MKDGAVHGAGELVQPGELGRAWGNPLFLIPPAIAVLLPVVLILKEPNLGTAFITGVVGFSIFHRRPACGFGRSDCWCCRCPWW